MIDPEENRNVLNFRSRVRRATTRYHATFGEAREKKEKDDDEHSILWERLRSCHLVDEKMVFRRWKHGFAL